MSKRHEVISDQRRSGKCTPFMFTAAVPMEMLFLDGGDDDEYPGDAIMTTTLVCGLSWGT